MDEQARGETTHRTSVGEGGTDTPIAGSERGLGEKDAVTGSGASRDEGEGQDDDERPVEGVHGRLTGSNPEAPGYGGPAEDAGE